MRQLAKLVTLQVLRGYKWAISPMFAPACRYVPSCSEYAIEAVERYGAVRGGLMALWRLLRCHPFAHGGYDPVVRASKNQKSPFSQTTREMECPELPQGLKPSHFFDASGTAESRALPMTVTGSTAESRTRLMSGCNQARTSQIAHHSI